MISAASRVAWTLTCMLALVCAPALPQEHQTKTLGNVKHKTTLDDLNLKLHAAAVEYGSQYGSIPRIALFVVVYPSTPAEDLALNRNAVLLITVVTQNATELPLKRVYIKDPNGEVLELSMLASYYAETESDPAVHKVLGPFRAETLCLLPIARIFTKSALHIDFAKNRAGFVLTEFPVVPPGDFILADKGQHPDPKKSVSNEVLKALLVRELPDFEHEKFTTRAP